MYNIIQLNDKELSELQSIAKELGIKNAESMKKDELVYGILDEQAIVNASKRNTNKDNESQPRKRSRVSVKKEGDKVYTATKEKAMKLEATAKALQGFALVILAISASVYMLAQLDSQQMWNRQPSTHCRY